MSSIQRHFTVSEATPQDEQLVLAARAGSHAAFGELQRIYSGRLYKRILSITRSREDAEDALQDTFLRAYLALPSFEGRCKFSSWLTRIAINSALMIIRRRRTRPEASLEQQSNMEEDAIAFDVHDNALNPEQVCDQKQRSSAILRAIQRLDPKLRVPIHLQVSHEHSMNEIASTLGITLASVKARLHRARKRLVLSPALQSRGMELMAANRSRLHCALQNREQPCMSGD